MGTLIVWVERKLVTSEGNCLVNFVAFNVEVDQVSQRCAELMSQFLALKELPLVKLGTIRQGESGHEIVSIQSRRGAQ